MPLNTALQWFVEHQYDTTKEEARRRHREGHPEPRKIENEPIVLSPPQIICSNGQNIMAQEEI
jgi:hypothetical protein